MPMKAMEIETVDFTKSIIHQFSLSLFLIIHQSVKPGMITLLAQVAMSNGHNFYHSWTFLVIIVH